MKNSRLAGLPARTLDFGLFDDDPSLTLIRILRPSKRLTARILGAHRRMVPVSYEMGPHFACSGIPKTVVPWDQAITVYLQTGAVE